jgi:hypothetical protein
MNATLATPLRDRTSPWWRVLLSPAGWIVLGLLVRIAHVVTLGNEYFFGDTSEYEQIALRILHGQGIIASVPRAPLYPLLLAFSFRIGGEENFFLARVLQLAIALAQMLLALRLARRIGGPAAAAFTAPLVALSPTNVFVAGLLYPTILYSTLLLAITLFAWELAEHPRARTAIALGALIVLGWLTDMVIVAPVFAIGVWLLVAARRRPRAMLGALGLAALTAVVLAMPYLSVLRSRGGDRVFMGKAQAVLHFARTDTLISRPRWIRMPPGTAYQGLPPRAFVSREWHFFRARPAAYLHDYTLEFLHFFQPLPDRITTKNRFNTPIVLWIGAAWFLLLLPTTFAGVLRGRAPFRARALLAAIVLVTAGFYAFFFTQARYRIPVVPHMAILAALALVAAFPRLSRLWAEPSAGETGPDR